MNVHVRHAVPSAPRATKVGGDLLDAELLRLGAELEAQQVEMMAARTACDMLERALKERTASPSQDDIEAAGIEVAVLPSDACAAAFAEEERLIEASDEIATRIRETPAKTLAGLLVKARGLAYDCHFAVDFEGVPFRDLDWQPKCLLGLIREIERMVASDR